MVLLEIEDWRLPKTRRSANLLSETFLLQEKMLP